MPRLLPQYRGIRIRPYMRYLSIYLFLILLFICLIPIGYFSYVNKYLVMMMDKVTVIIIAVTLLLSIGLSIYFTWFLREATPFFKKLERLERLSRFLYESGFVYEKKYSAKNKQNKIYYPKVYLKQGKYDLTVSFEMRGGKFQKRFKDIGGELEDTFFMDFMEKTDDPSFKIYKLAYSAFLARIKVDDVVWDKNNGIKLMNGYYWDFINDPHLLIAGGTGGGKTVLLRTLLKCLSTIAVVDICDPKRADFVTYADLSAFQGRVVFENEDIIAKFENLINIMNARYDFVRKEMKRLGHKDMKKFYDYGLEPYFFICDEFNALISSLGYQERDKVESALTQFILKGRQIGCNAIIAMQKPSADDLPTKIRSNMMHHISVGRLDDGGYMMLFGDENRNKEFKYIKYLSGRRVYGRGYSAVFGEVAREFYSPLLTKDFSFYDAFSQIERHDNPFDPNENSDISKDLANNLELKEFIEAVSDKKSLAFSDVEDDEMDFEQLISVDVLAKDIGKSTAMIRKIMVQIEEKEYYEFPRKDGKYMLTINELAMLTSLFEKKETYEGTWSQLIERYFVGE